jgi:uncharacterized protein YerC
MDASKGHTAEDIADDLGVSVVTVSKVRRGKTDEIKSYVSPRIAILSQQQSRPDAPRLSDSKPPQVP